MADRSPTSRSPLPRAAGGITGDPSLVDLSLEPKWRTFEADAAPPPGTAIRDDGRLVWSVSPGEWTTAGGSAPPGSVELTDVRAMMRLTGEAGRDVLAKVCGLDLSDAMFPTGAAARTLVGGVATEIVRDDMGTGPSWLLLPSRSFGRFLYDTLMDAGREHGLVHVEGAVP